ncbi:MAG: hypothetical protein ABIS86_23945, partial [Streptosporangiaceae bacterium]
DSDPLKRKVRLNPLLNFDAGLKVTSSVLMAILASPDTMAQLSTHGAGDSLTVAPPPTTDGPFIMITAVSASAADAKLMVERTITKSAEELQSRQANLGAPPSTFIHLEVVVPATPAASQIKSKVRGAAAVLGVGVALTLTLVYGLESFLTRRRQDDLPVAEPQAGTEPEDEPATVPEPEPERAG